MPKPLYLKVEQSFRGDEVSIVATLDGLADLLDRQIAAHEPPDHQGSREAGRSEFLEMVAKESARLAESFGAAGPAFEAAVQPSGGPRYYAEAYAALLNDLQSAAHAMNGAPAPQSMKRTEEAFTRMLETLAGQIKAWPEQLRQAARRVRGNSFELTLEAQAEVKAYYDALKKETNAEGAVKKPIQKMFFHPSTPVEAIADAIRAKARDLGLTKE